MTIENIKTFLEKQPFLPFQVVMSSGETYDITHPEAAILTRGGLVVAFKTSPGDLPDQVAICSLMHITAVKSLSLARQS